MKSRRLQRSCGKVVFKTKEDAETRAFYLTSMDPVFYPQPLRVYRCNVKGGCVSYHLTSAKLRYES